RQGGRMRGSRWGSLKLGLVAVVAIVMIVLIAQNTTPVATRLLFVTVTMPVAALLLMALLAGVVLGMAMASRFLPPSPAGGLDASGRARDVEPELQGSGSRR